MTKRTSQKIKNMSQKYPEISTKIISGYLYWCDENDFCSSRMLESVKNWFTKVGYPISDITLEYLIEASIRKMNRRKILGSKASSVTDISLVMVFFPDLELATKIFTKNSKDKMKKALSTLDANPILRKQGSNESIRERLGKESEDRIRDAKGKNQRIEFFVNQGYSEEEAKIMLSERQSTFSLKKCIEKYGNEKGMEIFKDRQDKWQSTLKSKTEEEILEMNKKKGITLDRMIEKYGVSDGNIRYKNWLHMLNNRILSIRSVSNESLKFFRSFIPDDILTEALFGRKSKELRIKRNNGHYYYYDFSYKNVIVEYHGKVWHPNPKKDSTDWKSIRGKTYEEALLHDCKKRHVARRSGYYIIEVYSNDDPEVLSTKKDQILQMLSNAKNLA